MSEEVVGLTGPREFEEERATELRLNPKFPYYAQPFPFDTVIDSKNLHDLANPEEEQGIDSNQL